MPLIQRSDSIAANATEENVLVGSLWERLPFNARLAFGLNASAIGLEIDVYTGSDAVVENLIPLIKTTTPLFPDDFALEDVAAAGERIKVRVRNTTGGALTLLTSVRISPF